MSNTILVSGSSESISLSVNPQIISVGVSISEPAITNTLEVNQFAGEYVSRIEAGEGIDVSAVGVVTTVSLASDISSFETDPVFTASPAGTITTTDIGNWNTAYGWGDHAQAGYLTSVGSLADNHFPIYSTSSGLFINAPAKYVSTDKNYVEFYQGNQGGVEVYFNSLLSVGSFTPEANVKPDGFDHVVSPAVVLQPNVTTFDSTRNLFYVFTYNSSSQDRTIVSVDLNGVLQSNVVIVPDDTGFWKSATYDATLDVVFASYRNNDGNGLVYALDPSDNFAVLSTAVVTDVDIAIVWSNHHSRLFVGQLNGNISLYSYVSDTLSLEATVTADYLGLTSNASDFVLDTNNNDVYFVNASTRLFKYNSSTVDFDFVESFQGRAFSSLTLPVATYSKSTGSIWIVTRDISNPVTTVYEYVISSGTKNTIANISQGGGGSVQFNDYDGLIYFRKAVTDSQSTDGYLHVYDPINKTVVKVINDNNVRGILGRTSLFSAYDPAKGTYKLSFVDYTRHDRNYPSAIKLTYGDYTQLVGDDPVDPKSDIELTTAGTNYVSHSPDGVSHHFFTNDDLGNDVKVLSIGDNTLYVYNSVGENSTVTKSKIDSWDSYGAGIDSVSFNTSTGLLTITDTEGVNYTASLEGRYLTEETITSLSLVGNTLTFTDENSTETAIDLSPYLDDTDTTYSISTKDNVTEGVDIDLTAGGDGSGVDTITVVGDQDVTVTQLGDKITISAPHETTTAISLANNVLAYTDEDGAVTNVDLSPYLDDTNDFVTSATFADGLLTLGVTNQPDVSVSLDGRYLQSETITSLSYTGDTLTYTDESGAVTNIDLSGYNETLTSISLVGNNLTYTDEDGIDTIIDLSSYLDDTNDFASSATFVDGVLTIGVTNQADVTVDLDGRYLQSETLTSISFASGTLTYNDEDGVATNLDLTSLSGDTTYDLSATTNLTAGVDINLVGSDSTTDKVNIIGGGVATVTESLGVITVSAPAETVTSISFTTDTLSYVDESGSTTNIDLSGYNETLTSLSFLGDTLTYTDENGTSNQINLGKYNETLTSISYVGDIITYTDENGSNTLIDLSGYNETLTSLTYSSGTLTYTDEGGTVSNLDISGLSGDTTYSVSTSDNATDGIDINLVGSDSSTDSINVVGTGDVTVSQLSDVITINAPHETTTSLSFANDTLTYTDEDGTATNISLSGFNETLTSLSVNANVLTYTDENGATTDIDLSVYLDDTNLARLVSGTLDGATGIATFTRDDATTFTVDFSALFDDTDTDTTYDLSVKDNATSGVDLDLTAGGDGSGTDTVVFRGTGATTVSQTSGIVTINTPVSSNDFVDGATFNTTNGVLTLSVGSQSDVTVDLDGRYLTSYTETDTLDSVATRGNTTDKSIKVGQDGGTPISELHVVGSITVEGDTAPAVGFPAVEVSQDINSTLSSFSAGQDSFLSWSSGFGFTDKTVHKKIATTGINQYFVSSATSGYNSYERHIQLDSTNSNPDFVRWDIGQWSGTGDSYKDISTTTGAALSIGRFAGVGARTEILRLGVDGDLTVAGAYSQSSIRYKKNVEDLEDRTEDVMSLRPVRYELKSNDKKDIGLIAEEVAEIFPEVIGYKDGEVNSIDYARLSVVLLQQVQKQQSMIDVLSERITKLENK